MSIWQHPCSSHRAVFHLAVCSTWVGGGVTSNVSNLHSLLHCSVNRSSSWPVALQNCTHKCPVALQVDVLSGGEKARLALAKFMLTQGTFLVLDEPTNHLDIPSKEMLEEALMKFEGAVVAVSHDRYFLRKISTRVVTVS